ncbi:MAG: S8 family serine peptidase [Dongiaceae bacterium]
MPLHDEYLVDTAALEVRAGAGPGFPAILTLAQGQTVILLDDQRADWWLVSVPGSATVPGFVDRRFLRARGAAQAIASREVPPPAAPPPAASAPGPGSAPARPAPSFLVVTLSEDGKAAEVDRSIQIITDSPAQQGTTLTALGERRYAVARAAAKALLAQEKGDARQGVLRRLGGLAAVTNAAWVDALEVRDSYAARPPAPPVAAAAHGAARVDDQGISWNVAMVRAPEAWAMAGGLAQRPWSAIRIGHIDTGATRHPALGFSAASPVSSFDLLADGINFVEAGQLPVDPLGYAGQPGHGTRTSSVLGALLGGTMLGVAPGVHIVPYRITDCVVIDNPLNRTRFAEAIRHAANDGGCQVMSVSLGDPCFPPEAVGAQLDVAYEHGVILVAAAGNITSEVTYPGRYSRAITAGGVTQAMVPWTGSSRGARVDLCAPAENVFRANTTLRNGAPLYEYLDTGGDGTSYATVHVAGAAALWLTCRAAELAPLRGTWRLVETFRWCLRRSARRPDGWNTGQWGAGVLDIVALLQCPLPDPGSLQIANPARREWA